MFSGIVESVGTVREFVHDKESAAMVIETYANFRNLENDLDCTNRDLLKNRDFVCFHFPKL